MARPVKFDPALGGRLVVAIASGKSRLEASKDAGICIRTLQAWLARGKESQDGFATWAGEFCAAERECASKRRWVRYDRETEEAKARWKGFKEARSRWWLQRLGPVEFWRRRFEWLVSKECWKAASEARNELRNARRSG